MKTFEVKKILIPVDFTYASLKAVNLAVLMAKLTKAEIMLIHVIDIKPSTAPAFYLLPDSQGYEKDLTVMSSSHLNNLAIALKKKGVEKVNVLVVRGRVYKEILRISKKIKTDIIIMGTHGASGFSEFFLGSNACRVVSHSKCAVLSVQRHAAAPQFKNIIVPFRDKSNSREKIDYAITVAKLFGATLHVFGVDTESTKSHLEKMILAAKQISKVVTESGVKCKIKAMSAPFIGDTVLEYAKKIKADLIIITADMDKVSISEYFMGPFAQQIVNHSPIPVLSIRPGFNIDTIDLRLA